MSAGIRRPPLRDEPQRQRNPAPAPDLAGPEQARHPAQVRAEEVHRAGAAQQAAPSPAKTPATAPSRSIPTPSCSQPNSTPRLRHPHLQAPPTAGCRSRAAKSTAAGGTLMSADGLQITGEKRLTIASTTRRRVPARRPGFPIPGRVSLDDYRAVAARFNRWGAIVRDQGMELAYLCHGHEFLPQDNSSGFDQLMQNTDPALVKLEVESSILASPCRIAMSKTSSTRISWDSSPTVRRPHR